jgi:hypothetical protein
MEDPQPKSETPSDASAAASSVDPVHPIELTPVHIEQMPPSPELQAPPAPLPDALPGDAAPTPLVPLAPIEESKPNPRVTIIRPPATPAAASSPRDVSFTLWALIWVAVWTGCMGLTLNHRFDRKFDWNTSYFSIAARNLVQDGFAKLHGGVYLNAGDLRDNFYAGHPPLTAWLLAGWMKLFGMSDAIIRSLPLAFSALNLLLLYALVKRVFSAPAALATIVICSLLPMTAYYAQIVNMEPFVMTFMLGASLGYLGWARSESKFGFLFMTICVILGCWTDWPMYIFTGFLAAAHLFKRRDLQTPLPRRTETGETEETKPGLPILSSLFLIVLPLAVFAAYLIYLKLNQSGFGALRDRAKDRMNGGYAQLFHHIRHPKDWFLGLFTPPALVLAALGLIFWVYWSRRLSLASGEGARRAAFRIILCMVLTQLIYTLAFPEGAVVHEFWQYYFTVPIAILAAAFCTWLTVVGGMGRKFSLGLFDRAGWALAAAIPFLAFGPMIYRLQIPGLGKEVKPGDARLDADYAGAIAKNTKIGDIILTDWRQGKADVPTEPVYHNVLGFALPWYTQRTILPFEGTDKGENDTRSIDGINKIRAEKEIAGRRILYLWSTDGPSALQDKLNLTYPQYKFGKAIVYLIQGQPDPSWRKASITIPESPAIVPPASVTPVKPAKKPATRPTTVPAKAAPK